MYSSVYPNFYVSGTAVNTATDLNGSNFNIPQHRATTDNIFYQTNSSQNNNSNINSQNTFSNSNSSTDVYEPYEAHAKNKLNPILQYGYNSFFGACQSNETDLMHHVGQDQHRSYYYQDLVEPAHLEPAKIRSENFPSKIS